MSRVRSILSSVPKSPILKSLATRATAVRSGRVSRVFTSAFAALGVFGQAALIGGAVTFGSSTPAAAQAVTPFACDGNGYAIFGSSPSDLQRINVSDLSPTTIGSLDPAITGNAIGYNLLDDYIYGLANGTAAGITSRSIVRIDANANVTNFGLPTGPGTFNPSSNSGTVDSDGNWLGLNSTRIFKVALGSNPTAGSLTFTTVTRSGLSDLPNDVSFSPYDGMLYGVRGASLVQINPNSGFAQIVATSGSLPNGAGGNWADSSGKLFMYNNGGGTLTELDLTQTPPVATLVGSVPPNPNFDATACTPPKLTKNASVAQANAGGSYDYTYTITNPFNIPITLDFDDALATGITYDLSSLSTPNPGGGTVSTFNGTTLAIDGMSIAGGATITFSVSVDVGNGVANGTFIDNQATITRAGVTLPSDDPDTAPINDPTRVEILASAAPPSPDVPFASCQAPDFSGITPDGLEDLSSPRGYWAASYYEGTEATAGSSANSPTNGTGGAGTPIFRGEAFFGAGENPVTINGNGSHDVYQRWTQNENPTAPGLPHPSYQGASWDSGGTNRHYMIDHRRTIDVPGVLTFGYDPATEVVDDTLEVFVNGTRVYAHFPPSLGSPPNTRPGAGGVGGNTGFTIPIAANDEVLVRFKNYGWIGGYAFHLNLAGHDCSDAPVSGTSYARASHIEHEASTLRLGATNDDDTTDISNADASGDGTEDDGVSSFPTLSAGLTSYSIPPGDFNAGSGDGNLFAWIDFDGNGAFDTTEFASTTVTGGALDGALSFSGYTPAPSPGNTFARFRLTTDTLTSADFATLGASDGEVEDYQVTVGPSVYSPPPFNGVCSEVPLDTAIVRGGFGGEIFWTHTQTGGNTLLTTSNLYSGAINALASNPDNSIVYYGDQTTMYYWDAVTDTHGTLGDLSTDPDFFGGNLQSAGASYLNGVLYVASEKLAADLDLEDVFAVTLSADGKSVIDVDPLGVYGAALADGYDFQAGANTNGFGDLVVTGDGPSGTIYGSTFDANTNTPGYWSFDLATADWTLISTTHPWGGGQTAADINGVFYASIGANLFQIDKATGATIGSPVNMGAAPVDLTGPFTSSQCSNDYDLSDAPMDGQTAPDAVSLTAYGAPRHNVGGGIKLGATNDIDASAIASNDATGDGAEDDGVVLPLLVQGQSQTIDVAVDTGIAPTAFLQAWIDWDGNGVFDVAEQIATDLEDNGSGVDAAANDGTLSFTVNVPASTTVAATFARFRWSTSPGLNATADASDGEVEDYQLVVQSKDYSDAPATYGDATHDVVSGIQLGAAIDADSASLASPAADGDGADDDGVPLPATFEPGTTINLPISVVGSGFLNAWIDWNGNGVFDGIEQIATDVQDLGGTGTINLPVTVPVDAVVAQTFARFRWSSAFDIGVDGAAPDGEVEDYQITIGDTSPMLSGTLFLDNGVGGDTAHDGLIGANETGAELGSVLITDGAGTQIAAATVNPDGTWNAMLPVGYSGPVQVDVVPSPGYRTISEDVSGVPGATNPDSTDGTFSFNAAAGVAYSGLNIGLIEPPTLTQDQSTSVSPGQIVDLAHVYTATTRGDVSLALVDQVANPAGGFASTILADTDCDGTADGILPASTAVTVGQQLCVVVRTQAGSGISPSASYSYGIEATTALTGTVITETARNDDALGSSGSGEDLVLRKLVSNLTKVTPEGVSNTGDVGDVLQYRIIMTNPGPGTAADVTVSDKTPAFTVLSGPIPSPVTVAPGVTCSVVTPASNAAGYAGPLEWSCPGSMPSGVEGSLTFQVTISP